MHNLRFCWKIFDVSLLWFKNRQQVLVRFFHIFINGNKENELHIHHLGFVFSDYEHFSQLPFS